MTEVLLAIMRSIALSGSAPAVLLTFLWLFCSSESAPAAEFPTSGSPLNRTNLLVYRDAHGEEHPVTSTRHWQRRREAILTAMQDIMGPLPQPARRAPLDPRVEEEADCGSYIRRFLTYVAEPGSRVPAYLLIPKSVLQDGRRAPGVLCLHQTHPQGQRVVVGLGNSPDDEYGVELVRRGYVCLAPAYPLLANYAPDLAALGYASGTLKAVWDNMRGLDLLESLPFVQRGRFGAIGHSLGGHNAIFTAAFDTRIRVVVSSCGLDLFEDYMDGNIRGWTSSRYMPRLLAHAGRGYPFDFAEVVAALAPRHCFISAPLHDSNFKWRSVDRIQLAAQPVFDLLRAGARLRVLHPDCAHRFPPDIREQAYQVIDAALRN
jgi:dienelactone hydrolase